MNSVLPLNAIIGFGQLLLAMTEVSQDQREYVNEILKGGRHLLMIIQRTAGDRSDRVPQRESID